MGWIQAGICVFAATRLNGHGNLFGLSVIVAIANVWSFGVMHNYRADPQNIPNAWNNINMISTFVGVGLFIASFF